MWRAPVVSSRLFSVTSPSVIKAGKDDLPVDTLLGQDFILSRDADCFRGQAMLSDF
jgi:hypothetical protein